MRLGLFDGGRLGLVQGSEVVDVSQAVPLVSRAGRLTALIEAGTDLITPELVAAAPRRPLPDIAWEAPLPRPGKVIGAPANYYEHADEMPNSSTIVEWGFFLKASTSVIGPGGTIELPYSDMRTDYEGELAVVIGRGGRDIPREQALKHVFGYTCVLDITVRSTEDRSTRKSFETFTPLGPTVVTADEIDDVAALEVRLELNGEERQRSTTGLLIYGVPELIAYASSVTTLEPGDVIATGTPAGVGAIADGDALELTVSEVGTLTATVSGRRAISYANRPGPSTARTRQ